MDAKLSLKKNSDFEYVSSGGYMCEIDSSMNLFEGTLPLPEAVFRYAVEDTLSPYSVTFTDASSYEPTAWHWQFGDGAVSQDTNPVHTYPAPGTYQVCMVVSNVYLADTLCRDVRVGTVDVHDLPVLPLVTVRPNPFSDYLQVSLPA
jgi:PKD repeat protein